MVRISPRLMTWAVDLMHLHLMLVSRLSSDRPVPQGSPQQVWAPRGGGTWGHHPPHYPIPSHPIPDTRRLLLMGFAARLISPSTTSKLLFLDIEGV